MSQPAYIGKGQFPKWLNHKFVLGLFNTNLTVSEERYREFVEDLIGKEYDSPLQQTVASTILGGADFVESVMGDYLEKEIERPDVPAVRALNRRFAVENIVAKVQEVIADPNLARDVALYLCHRYSGETLKNIGSCFGLGDSGVAKASTRLRTRLETEDVLRDRVKEIIKCLGYVKIQT